MITKAAFLAIHSEFAAKQDAVDYALAQAELQTDATIFGVHTDEAHRWLTAHILATAPDGTGARLTPEGASVEGVRAVAGGTSIYMVERRRIEDLVAPLQMAGADAALDETLGWWC